MKLLADAAAMHWPLTPSDSARAVEGVYTASLLITVPLVLAVVAAIALRNASAGARSLIWRSAILSLLLVFLCRALPSYWISWVVPDVLSAPLVLLGRMQVTALQEVVARSASSGATAAGTWRPDTTLVIALFSLYMAGVLLVVFPTARAWVAIRRRTQRATLVTNTQWLSALADVRHSLGVKRDVQLRIATDERGVFTCGVFHPVIMLPQSAMHLAGAERRAILLHEMAHVKNCDWIFGLAARLACALYWFHPAVWCVARTLRAECELACDDRVLAGGVRASAYANLLIRTANHLLGSQPHRDQSVASVSFRLMPPEGLRGRLAALSQTHRNTGAPKMAVIIPTFIIAVGVALPTGTVALAPGRDVLRELMFDSRWESRAYAVRGLAQRPDSVRVAEYAATLDPDPLVRASARDALRGRGTPGRQ